MQSEDGESVRADVWLWAARFFKTRRLSREALDGGKVALNGVTCKPSRAVRVGDELCVTRGEERFEIVVLDLSGTRGPAREAAWLYSETAASRAARERRRELRRMAGPVAPPHRPDSQARRLLRRAKRRTV